MDTSSHIDLRGRLRLLLEQDSLELPMLPTVAAEVMTLCSDELSDAARLSSVLHGDQALASNVLRVANSPLYAGQLPIVSLQQAVSRLGLNQVSDIAMAVAVRSRVFATAEHEDLLRALWVHSVLAGFFAKEVARMRRCNVEIAFVCGLLHDIGKVVLLANLDRAGEASETVDRDELGSVLHEMHTDAGCVLASKWKLPDQLGEAIAYHHDFAAAEGSGEVAKMTCLGDLLAHVVMPTPSGPDLTVDAVRAHDVVAALNLYPDEFEELFGHVDRALEFVEAMG